MARETFAHLASHPDTSAAVLASGQNLDGSPFTLDVTGLPRRVTTLGTTAVLLAGAAVTDVVGTAAAPVDVSAFGAIVIGSTRAPDTVLIEFGWSRAAGTAPDFYEAVTVPTGTTVRRDTQYPFLHVRVTNTSATVALTAHRTSVNGY